MGLTSWLRENLFDGAPGWLARRGAATRRVPSLLAYLLPYLLRSRADEPDAPTQVARASRGGRELFVAGPAPVELETAYADWVAPLARLPEGATPARFRLAAESLPGHGTDGRHFFPADAYLGAVRHAPPAELAHCCRASRQTSLELLHALTATTPSPDDDADEHAAFLVHTRRSRPARKN